MHSLFTQPGETNAWIWRFFFWKIARGNDIYGAFTVYGTVIVSVILDLFKRISSSLKKNSSFRGRGRGRMAGQPPPGGIKEQLGTIYKQIKEAQTLDVNGDEMVGRYSRLAS